MEKKMSKVWVIVLCIITLYIVVYYIPNKAWLFNLPSQFSVVPISVPVFLPPTVKIKSTWGFQQKIFIDPHWKTDKPCIMYGLGIADDLTFERVMKQRKDCTVYAFDCTSPPHIAEYAQTLGIHFYPWCIGEAHAFNRGNVYTRHSNVNNLHVFKPLHQVMQELGHTYISLLKMDIEGFEWSVFSSMLKNNETIWPDQLAFELHLQGAYEGAVNPKVVQNKGIEEMMQLFRDLFHVGYEVLFKELNPSDAYCCEFTLFKR
jgi:hypothetical protein